MHKTAPAHPLLFVVDDDVPVLTPAAGVDVAAAPDEITREDITTVLRQTNGNRMVAAKLLGISRRALYRPLERHHLLHEVPARPAAFRTKT